MVLKICLTIAKRISELRDPQSVFLIRYCDNLSLSAKPAKIAVVTSCCARESQFGRCVNIISAVNNVLRDNGAYEED